MNLSQQINELKDVAIAKILYSARSEFQVRMFATIIENFLQYLLELQILIGILLHCWTIWLAYERGDIQKVILTVVTPVFSEVYWLYVLLFESIFSFVIYLLAIIIALSLIYVFGQFKTVGFVFSYTLVEIMNRSKK